MMFIVRQQLWGLMLGFIFIAPCAAMIDGKLTSQELACFAAGQAVQQDVIAMLEKYIQDELAAGAVRGDVLIKIHEAFKHAAHPQFSTSDYVMLVGCGVIAGILGYCTAYCLYGWLSTENINPPISQDAQSPGAQAPDEVDNDDANYHDDQKSDTFSEQEVCDLKSK